MLALLVPLLLLAGGCHAAVLPHGSRVVNGQDAVPYSWPWQISLQYERDGTFSHTCGGTLIAPDWVMTAAHCISSTLTYEVVLGEYDMSSAEGPEQRIPVAADDIFVHPKWNRFCAACGNDIALLKLRRNAVLNDYVQTGRLPPAGTVLPNGYPCYLSGWGRLTTGGPLPDKLQDALMPVVDHEQCTASPALCLHWAATLRRSPLSSPASLPSMTGLPRPWRTTAEWGSSDLRASQRANKRAELTPRVPCAGGGWGCMHGAQLGPYLVRAAALPADGTGRAGTGSTAAPHGWAHGDAVHCGKGLLTAP
uniref:Chymotrypsin like elastase 3B n=1 Tax=Gallus gallus TaxID=9031 RepID=A0A8V0Z346_CHICK